MTLAMAEVLAGRKFRQVTVSGEPKFVPGQHAAKKFTPTDALVSYVDHSGAVCIVPCDKIGNEWFHRGVLIQVTMMTAQARVMPRMSSLSEDCVRALQAKKRPAASSRTTQD